MPANELPLVDEAYQRWIAKYKFIADHLAGISQLYEWQVSAAGGEQEDTNIEETTQTNSLHWSDLAEVTVVPKESPPKEPSRTIGDPTEIGHPKKNRILQLQNKQPSTGQQGPSPNTTVREQQQALQVVRQFFNIMSVNTEEPGPLLREALSGQRPEVIIPTRREPRQDEETLQDQGSTTTAKRIPSRSMENMGSNGSPQAEEQTRGPRMVSEPSSNVSVVSPNLVNPVTSMSHDLIWPSQLQVRRERLFPEGAIHPNWPNEQLNRDGAWRLLRPYDLPGVWYPTANALANQQWLAENEESVESLQILEYLLDVPGVGRRDFRRYPPHYGDPFYRRGAGRGRGNHPDRRPPPFQDQPPPDPPAGRGRARMDSPHSLHIQDVCHI